MEEKVWEKAINCEMEVYESGTAHVCVCVCVCVCVVCVCVCVGVCVCVCLQIIDLNM